MSEIINYKTLIHSASFDTAEELWEDEIDKSQVFQWGDTTTITYTYLQQLPTYYVQGQDEEAESGYFKPLTTQIDSLNILLGNTNDGYQALFEDVANIVFSNVSNELNADNVGALTFGGTLFLEAPAYAYVPWVETGDKQGDVWIDWGNNDPQNSNYSIGEPGFTILLHEIGHALGLEHPWAKTSYELEPHLKANELNYKYTIMVDLEADHQHPDMHYVTGVNEGKYIYSLGLYDIAALQAIYGENTTTRADDTTYKIDQGLQDEAFIYTIWDGGGNDTIDATGYEDGVEIDLRAGHFSSIGKNGNQSGSRVRWDEDAIVQGEPADYDAGNVAIAFGTVIENAVGTAHDDHLIGNQYNNTLTGGDGADILNGGSGSDTADYSHDLDLNGDERGVTVTLDSNGDGTATDGWGNTDTLISIENLKLSNFNDSLTVTMPGETPRSFDGGGNGDFDTIYYGMGTVYDANTGHVMDINDRSNYDVLTGFENVATEWVLPDYDADFSFHTPFSVPTFSSLSASIAPSYDYSGAESKAHFQITVQDTITAFDIYNDQYFYDRYVDAEITLPGVTHSGPLGEAKNISFLSIWDIFNGGAAATVTLKGTNKDDTVEIIDNTDSGLLNVTFYTGGGNDNITIDPFSGGTGITIGYSSGQDTVTNAEAVSDVIMQDGITRADLDVIGNGAGGFTLMVKNLGWLSLDEVQETAVHLSGGDVITLSGDGTASINGFYYYIDASDYLSGVDISLVATGGTAYGSDYGDIITGGAGDDTIFGNGGDDVLISGAGSDTLDGGAGNDQFLIGKDGFATITDGEGLNNIQVTDVLESGAYISWSSLDPVTLRLVDFASGQQIATFNRDEVSSVEINEGFGSYSTYLTQGYWLRTSEYGDYRDVSNDSIFTDSVVLNLHGGNDTYIGTDFGDVIRAGNGSDNLQGGVGDDNFIGGAGNDILSGGGGNDTLTGGAGNDALAGGDGSDTYIFAPGDGFDTIEETGGSDTLKIKGGLTLQDLAFTQVGDDLVIDIASGVTISGQFSGDPALVVEWVSFDDGTVVSLPNPIMQTNQPPIAVGEQFAIDEDSTLMGNVLLNDSDPDGDVLSVDPFTLVTDNGGTVEMLESGDFTYTPAENFYGIESFDYTLYDPGGLSDIATVTIEVLPVNDAPEAADDHFEILEDHTFSGDLLADNGQGADFDIEGDQLSAQAAIITTAAGGTVQIYSDGTFDYTPELNFFGTDSFEYTLTDGGLIDTAVATIEVLPVNDTPEAVGDSYETLFAQSLSGNVLTNDIDVDGDVLSIEAGVFQTAGGGLVTMNEDGSFTYDPASGFYGEDSFDYITSDPAGLTDTATVNINVKIPGTTDGTGEGLDEVIVAADGDVSLTGGNGDAFLYGGSESVNLNGGNGNDVLWGGGGSNSLQGGGGADLFFFDSVTAFEEADVIRDFNTKQGDVLDISNIISDYDPVTDALSDFVQLTGKGGNKTLEVDLDGSGGEHEFAAIAIIQGANNLTVEDMAADGSLVFV